MQCAVCVRGICVCVHVYVVCVYAYMQCVPMHMYMYVYGWPSRECIKLSLLKWLNNLLL